MTKNEIDDKFAPVIEAIDSVIDGIKNDNPEVDDKPKVSGKSKKSRKTDENRATEIVPAEQLLPNKLPIVPLQGRPIFPGVFTPLMINSPDDTKLVEQAYSGDGCIGIVMLKNDEESPSAKDLYQVGTAARIIKKINLPDGGVNVFISTVKRFKIPDCCGG